MPTVAIYERNEQEEYAKAWANFDPKIANCFTNDLKACNKLLSRVSENAWQCLSIGLKQLDNLEEIGLRHVDIDIDLVNNSF